MARRRLARIHQELSSPPEVIGQLTLGGITFEVPVASTPSRLPHTAPLDLKDGMTTSNLHFMLQKYLLGQDIFLLSQPGPYARRLAMTFCRQGAFSL